jgi:2-methylcitrate dehydratase PrpD
MEPAVRDLMQKITVSVNPDYPYGMVKMTVRNNAGAQITKETQTRNGLNFGPPMTHDDIIAKYRRICEFMHVSDAQRDRALAQWSDLRSVKDIADAIQTLATFGRPRPL